MMFYILENIESPRCKKRLISDYDAVAFDLMDTLIEPPSRESISNFLSSSPLFFDLSEFQRKLFEIGFPYAPFINSLDENYEFMPEIKDTSYINISENIFHIVKK